MPQKIIEIWEKKKGKRTLAVWLFWASLTLLLLNFYPLWVRIVVAAYMASIVVAVGIRDLSNLATTPVTFAILTLGIVCFVISGLYEIFNPVAKWPIPMMLMGLLTMACGGALYHVWLRQRAW